MRTINILVSCIYIYLQLHIGIIHECKMKIPNPYREAYTSVQVDVQELWNIMILTYYVWQVSPITVICMCNYHKIASVQ